MLTEWYFKDLFPSDRAKHGFNILDTLNGAFVSGYIFHWVVTIIPEGRKTYYRRREIEKIVVAILEWYRVLFHELLKNTEQIEGLKGSLFKDGGGKEDVILIYQRLAREHQRDPKKSPLRIESFAPLMSTVNTWIHYKVEDLWEFSDRMDDDLRSITRKLMDNTKNRAGSTVEGDRKLKESRSKNVEE